MICMVRSGRASAVYYVNTIRAVRRCRGHAANSGAGVAEILVTELRPGIAKPRSGSTLGHPYPEPIRPAGRAPSVAQVIDCN
jgi:hypothetical protein